MSDLRKAIEELAAFHESHSDGKGLDLAEDDDFDRGWYGANRALAAELRQALDANPEPEPEWEWAVRFGCGERKHAESRRAAEEMMARMEVADGTCLPMTLKKRAARTAPGPWIEVTEP